MVLVILIACWAMVLLPPYLKDRRTSGRTFRPMQSSGRTMPPATIAGAQRFLPLQNAPTGYSTSAVTSPTGMRTTTPRSVNRVGSNVVPLRPVESRTAPTDPVLDIRNPIATSAADYLAEAPPHDESLLHQAWDQPDSAGLGVPTSTSAARERRRQVLLALTATAFVTLLLAYFSGGNWIAAHVLVDVVMLGYVILLVRHRQLIADRLRKVEPIRPPVNEQAPATMQLAPSYLLRSSTGS